MSIHEQIKKLNIVEVSIVVDRKVIEKELEYFQQNIDEVREQAKVWEIRTRNLMRFIDNTVNGEGTDLIKVRALQEFIQHAYWLLPEASHVHLVPRVQKPSTSLEDAPDLTSDKRIGDKS